MSLTPALKHKYMRYMHQVKTIIYFDLKNKPRNALLRLNGYGKVD